jgi:hypothetical protein
MHLMTAVYTHEQTACTSCFVWHACTVSAVYKLMDTQLVQVVLFVSCVATVAC